MDKVVVVVKDGMVREAYAVGYLGYGCCQDAVHLYSAKQIPERNHKSWIIKRKRCGLRMRR